MDSDALPSSPVSPARSKATALGSRRNAQGDTPLTSSASRSPSKVQTSGLPNFVDATASSDSAQSVRKSPMRSQMRTPTHSEPASPLATRFRNTSTSSTSSVASRSPTSPTVRSTQRNGISSGSARRFTSISQGQATASSSSLASTSAASSSSNGKQGSPRRSDRPQRTAGEAYRLGKVGVLPLTQDAVDVRDDGRAIVWLDIDNTLYRKSTRIAELMTERIRAYFLSLGLSTEEAEQLHSRYYKEYGLAIRGLVMHHQIDALDYDAKCDAALPLERILRPDRRVTALLRDLDRTKCRVWALTNAYKTHAIRVLDLLGLTQYIEGVVFCDYGNERFACKPETEFYESAMEAVAMRDPSRCYFVDDSALNIRAARALHWRSCVLFQEQDNTSLDDDADGSDIPSDSVLAYTIGESSGLPRFRDASELQTQVRVLPQSLKEHLLRLTLEQSMPNDKVAVERIIREVRSVSRSYFDDLPLRVVLQILRYSTVPELLRCRRVSRKWKTQTSEPSLWEALLAQLSQGDAYPPKVQHDTDYEIAAKALYLREQNWARGRCQSLLKMQGHTGLVTAIKLRGRSTLVTGSYDETIRVWNLSTGACTKILRAKAISCLDFSIENGVLVAGLYDTGRVMLWDLKTWTLLQTLSGHNKGIRQVSIKGAYLVSVGQDKAIVVWDWRNGTKIVRFGQQSNVSLGVSIVGQDKLVAVTVDGVIRTFDLAPSTRDMIGQFDIRKLSGALATRLSGLKDGSKMLQWFAAHGSTMTTGSTDTIIHLRWKASKGEAVLSRANGDATSKPRIDGDTIADLTMPPEVVNIVHTTDTALGCVDAAKQRIVCARRATSQRTSSSNTSAGNDRRLFTTTLDGEHATKRSLDGNSANGTTAGGGIVPISGGAWQTHAAELCLPAHNPTALACDQDRCVVGTSSGLVYSLGFASADKGVCLKNTATASPRQRRISSVSSPATPPRRARTSLTPLSTPSRRPQSSAPASPQFDKPQTAANATSTVDESTLDSDALNVEVSDLLALRSVWSHLFVS